MTSLWLWNFVKAQVIFHWINISSSFVFSSLHHCERISYSIETEEKLDLLSRSTLSFMQNSDFALMVTIQPAFVNISFVITATYWLSFSWPTTLIGWYQITMYLTKGEWWYRLGGTKNWIISLKNACVQDETLGGQDLGPRSWNMFQTFLITYCSHHQQF